MTFWSELKPSGGPNVSLTTGARTERNLLAIGTGLTLVGIALSTGESSMVAGVITLMGLGCLVIGLHRFGRSGPDGPSAKRTKTRS